MYIAWLVPSLYIGTVRAKTAAVPLIKSELTLAEELRRIRSDVLIYPLL